MIIADTGFWVAMFNEHDAFHAAAIKVAGRILRTAYHHLACRNRGCVCCKVGAGNHLP